MGFASPLALNKLVKKQVIGRVLDDGKGDVDDLRKVIELEIISPNFPCLRKLILNIFPGSIAYLISDHAPPFHCLNYAEIGGCRLFKKFHSKSKSSLVQF